MTTTELLERLDGVKKQGDGWVAKCPAHDDRHASLSVHDRAGTLLAHCHAGCAFDAILAAVPAPPPSRTERLIDATYTYRSADGTALYDVIRYRPKDFRQRRADGTWSMEGVPRVLYRLPELLASTKGVVVVEGEKDADRLAALDIVATCNVGGAGKWRTEYADALRGRTVVIIPDNDDPGRAHAADVARSLDGIADVRILELPVPPKGDVSAWLDAGGDAASLRQLLRDAPPFHSLERDAPTERNLSERFRSPSELLDELPETIEGPCVPWLVYGALTELVGGAKTAGKTTLLGHAIAAILDGRPFLNRPTTPGPIVFLTEQPLSSLRSVLERTHLTDRPGLRILLWKDTRDASWPEIVAGAVAECQRVGSRLLIVDTLPAFAGLRGDAENDAGAALDALEPLQVAAGNGLAVVVVRHERKGGGEVGESGRGSTAFTGAVDVVLRLARQAKTVRPTIRELSALSRFDDTPPELVIELTDAGYVVLGDKTAVAFDEAERGVLAALKTADGMLEHAIVEAVDGKATTVGAALRGLVAAGRVTRDGGGKRGSPYVYSLTPTDSGIVSPIPPMGGMARESISGPNADRDPGRDLVAEARRIFADDLVDDGAA